MSNNEPVRSTETERELSADDRRTANRAACDFCGRARTPEERNRLVWQSALGPRLVLAELCRRCAARADALLELYGGHGRDAIKLEQHDRTAPPPMAAQHRVLGFTARGILYLLVALIAFVVVTLLTARGR